MTTETAAQNQADASTAFLRAARAGHLDKILNLINQDIDINVSNANGLNAIHLASKDGHVPVVLELLQRGAHIDAATKKGNTALHIASLAGQETIVKLLVQNGAQVNIQSQNGFTPLYMAAQENHDGVVKFLLSSGANQSLATEDGFTPLAVAMQQGHEKVVAVLLEADTRGRVRLPALHIAAKKDDVKAATLLLENEHNPDVTSKSGFTPLHIAAHYGNDAIARLLLAKGADVNFPAKHNICPLHVAAKWGKENLVMLLLERNGNVESRTRDGLTPLHCAARSGHERVIDLLLERGAPITSKSKNGLAPLHMAAQGDHAPALKALLAHRAAVDEVTADYLTALHVSAHCGHVKAAKLLLERGADADARALNGFTPLHIACKKNRIKVVELLLKHGASISATTESGLTPLHVASFMGCMNIVIYLLQHDAPPDAATVRGETPLHLAARANQTDIIRILLRNGAAVEARARERQTPLHVAARLGHADNVLLLLQHGAAPDAAASDRCSALHLAAKHHNHDVAQVLIENGAPLTATTKKGFTPLHLAAKYGNLKVANLLLQHGAPPDAAGKNGVTPLHVAAQYDQQQVATVLLEKGANAKAAAKNGHTPLHIAARKNQMETAGTLLEYGALPNTESKAGFTPLHLAAQQGHVEMCSLLIEHEADPNRQAKNGLTSLHLAAQEDRVPVAGILVKNGAKVNTCTVGGYIPLHVASHFGQTNMVRFLLDSEALVYTKTCHGYTALHHAAQQGHINIVNLLLERNADANAVTNNGQTALGIAQKLGYVTVVETLKSASVAPLSPTSPTAPQAPAAVDKYKVVAPETMLEIFMSDSEEEGGEDTILTDQPYRYLTADDMKSLGDDSLPIDVTRDERAESLIGTKSIMDTSQGSMGPPYVIDELHNVKAINHLYNTEIMKEGYCYNVDGVQPNFLVSFLVDARGGAMRGCRGGGVKVIVPPYSAQQPTRITCRYLKASRINHMPPLMEGEALASRVLELGPISAKFLGPIILEVPHYASLRGKEREIVILRSDNGTNWREHTLEASDEVVQDILNDTLEIDDPAEDGTNGPSRTTRILTHDFPQYFAVISRIRQEVHAIGPEGGMVSSSVVPQVQAVFPQGALTKKIKVGLQAQSIDPELTVKLFGRGVAVSPVVTVEPRRRKFHKAITLSMPAPRPHSQGMINQYTSSAPTLRLLCSISGGTNRAHWEDVTENTPLTFVNDCVSFTTTVSARYWLIDCRNVADATKMATELYREAIHVPFIARFIVYARRMEQLQSQLRVFCVTDDREDKTLEKMERFTQVAKSRDVEVHEGKPCYLEFAGNMVPIAKTGEQHFVPFRAFRENRLAFNVMIKSPHADPIARCQFMREPKVAKGEPSQTPVCVLNILIPEEIIPEDQPIDIQPYDQRDSIKVVTKTLAVEEQETIRQQRLSDPRLSDICNLLGKDWVALAYELGVSTATVNQIQARRLTASQQAEFMLKLWKTQSGNMAQDNSLELALCRIGRDDIIAPQSNVETERRIKRNMYQEKQDSDEIEGYRLKQELDKQKGDEAEERDIYRMVERDDGEGRSEMEEAKYSPEEKSYIGESTERDPSISPSDESEDDEGVKRSVAERKMQITRKLSSSKVPASKQKKELREEIIEIKRQINPEIKKFHIQQSTVVAQVEIPRDTSLERLKSRLSQDSDSPATPKDIIDLHIEDKIAEEKTDMSSPRPGPKYMQKHTRTDSMIRFSSGDYSDIKITPRIAPIKDEVSKKHENIDIDIKDTISKLDNNDVKSPDIVMDDQDLKIANASLRDKIKTFESRMEHSKTEVARIETNIKLTEEALKRHTEIHEKATEYTQEFIRDQSLTAHSIDGREEPEYMPNVDAETGIASPEIITEILDSKPIQLKTTPKVFKKFDRTDSTIVQFSSEEDSEFLKKSTDSETETESQTTVRQKVEKVEDALTLEKKISKEKEEFAKKLSAATAANQVTRAETDRPPDVFEKVEHAAVALLRQAEIGQRVDLSEDSLRVSSDEDMHAQADQIHTTSAGTTLTTSTKAQISDSISSDVSKKSASDALLDSKSPRQLEPGLEKADSLADLLQSTERDVSFISQTESKIYSKQTRSDSLDEASDLEETQIPSAHRIQDGDMRKLTSQFLQWETHFSAQELAGKRTDAFYNETEDVRKEPVISAKARQFIETVPEDESIQECFFSKRIYSDSLEESDHNLTSTESRRPSEPESLKSDKSDFSDYKTKPSELDEIAESDAGQIEGSPRRYPRSYLPGSRTDSDEKDTSSASSDTKPRRITKRHSRAESVSITHFSVADLKEDRAKAVIQPEFQVIVTEAPDDERLSSFEREDISDKISSESSREIEISDRKSSDDRISSEDAVTGKKSTSEEELRKDEDKTPEIPKDKPSTVDEKTPTAEAYSIEFKTDADSAFGRADFTTIETSTAAKRQSITSSSSGAMELGAFGKRPSDAHSLTESRDYTFEESEDSMGAHITGTRDKTDERQGALIKAKEIVDPVVASVKVVHPKVLHGDSLDDVEAFPDDHIIEHVSKMPEIQEIGPSSPVTKIQPLPQTTSAKSYESTTNVVKSTTTQAIISKTEKQESVVSDATLSTSVSLDRSSTPGEQVAVSGARISQKNDIEFGVTKAEVSKIPKKIPGDFPKGEIKRRTFSVQSSPDDVEEKICTDSESDMDKAKVLEIIEPTSDTDLPIYSFDPTKIKTDSLDDADDLFPEREGTESEEYYIEYNLKTGMKVAQTTNERHTVTIEKDSMLKVDKPPPRIDITRSETEERSEESYDIDFDKKHAEAMAKAESDKQKDDKDLEKSKIIAEDETVTIKETSVGTTKTDHTAADIAEADTKKVVVQDQKVEDIQITDVLNVDHKITDIVEETSLESKAKTIDMNGQILQGSKLDNVLTSSTEIKSVIDTVIVDAQKTLDEHGIEQTEEIETTVENDKSSSKNIVSFEKCTDFAYKTIEPKVIYSTATQIEERNTIDEDSERTHQKQSSKEIVQTDNDRSPDFSPEEDTEKIVSEIKNLNRSDRRCSDFLEEISQTQGTLVRIDTSHVTRDLSLKFSKTPPPSPVDLIAKDKSKDVPADVNAHGLQPKSPVELATSPSDLSKTGVKGFDLGSTSPQQSVFLKDTSKALESTTVLRSPTRHIAENLAFVNVDQPTLTSGAKELVEKTIETGLSVVDKIKQELNAVESERIQKDVDDKKAETIIEAEKNIQESEKFAQFNLDKVSNAREEPETHSMKQVTTLVKDFKQEMQLTKSDGSESKQQEFIINAGDIFGTEEMKGLENIEKETKDIEQKKIAILPEFTLLSGVDVDVSKGQVSFSTIITQKESETHMISGSECFTETRHISSSDDDSLVISKVEKTHELHGHEHEKIEKQSMVRKGDVTEFEKSTSERGQVALAKRSDTEIKSSKKSTDDADVTKIQREYQEHGLYAGRQTKSEEKVSALKDEIVTRKTEVKYSERDLSHEQWGKEYFTEHGEVELTDELDEDRSFKESVVKVIEKDEAIVSEEVSERGRVISSKTDHVKEESIVESKERDDLSSDISQETSFKSETVDKQDDLLVDLSPKSRSKLFKKEKEVYDVDFVKEIKVSASPLQLTPTRSSSQDSQSDVINIPELEVEAKFNSKRSPVQQPEERIQDHVWEVPLQRQEVFETVSELYLENIHRGSQHLRYTDADYSSASMKVNGVNIPSVEAPHEAIDLTKDVMVKSGESVETEYMIKSIESHDAETMQKSLDSVSAETMQHSEFSTEAESSMTAEQYQKKDEHKIVKEKSFEDICSSGYDTDLSSAEFHLSKLETERAEASIKSQQPFPDMSVLEKTINEVKQSLEAAQEEIISEKSDGSCKYKQSPSEFQFKLMSPDKPEVIHEEPAHYDDRTDSSIEEKDQTKSIVDMKKTPISLIEEKVDGTQGIIKLGDECNIAGKSFEISMSEKDIKVKVIEKESDKQIDFDFLSDEERDGSQEKDKSRSQNDFSELSAIDSGPHSLLETTTDTSDRDESTKSSPENVRLRAVHKHIKSRIPIKTDRKSTSDIEGWSSSGDSHYQSFEKSDSPKSRPLSSDVENLMTGHSTGEYESALTTQDFSSRSLRTSKDYYTAASSVTSRESMKSLDSESSGHLASIDISDASETLVPSANELKEELLESGNFSEQFEIERMESKSSHYKDNESDLGIRDNVSDEGSPDEDLPGSEEVVGKMKRSHEMRFQPTIPEKFPLESTESIDFEDLDSMLSSRVDGDRSLLKDFRLGNMSESIQSTSSSSITKDVETVIEAKSTKVVSGPRISTVPHGVRDEVDFDSLTDEIIPKGSLEYQKITQDFKKSTESFAIGSKQSSTSSVKDQLSTPLTPVSIPSHSSESTDNGREYVLDDMYEISEGPELFQTITDSKSELSVTTEERTLYEAPDEKGADSPVSDEFEMVDKPSEIDDFVVIEEVAREATETDMEGKSLSIKKTVYIKKHDDEVENYLTQATKTEKEVAYSTSSSLSEEEMAAFELEQKRLRTTENAEIEAGRKWIQMQFEGDGRYDYERVPLEDIKEEEMTDFDASRIGSLSSQKESVGSYGSMKNSYGSLSESEILSRRRYIPKSGEQDDMSVSSLQEFENLEKALMEQYQQHSSSSQDSLNGSLPKRHQRNKSGQGDDISMASLKEFEGLENACVEVLTIEMTAKQKEALLSQDCKESTANFLDFERRSYSHGSSESSPPQKSGSPGQKSGSPSQKSSSGSKSGSPGQKYGSPSQRALADAVAIKKLVDEQLEMENSAKQSTIPSSSKQEGPIITYAVKKRYDDRGSFFVPDKDTPQVCEEVCIKKTSYQCTDSDEAPGDCEEMMKQLQHENRELKIQKGSPRKDIVGGRTIEVVRTTKVIQQRFVDGKKISEIVTQGVDIPGARSETEFGSGSFEVGSRKSLADSELSSSITSQQSDTGSLITMIEQPMDSEISSGPSSFERSTVTRTVVSSTRHISSSFDKPFDLDFKQNEVTIKELSPGSGKSVSQTTFTSSKYITDPTSGSLSGHEEDMSSSGSFSRGQKEGMLLGSTDSLEATSSNATRATYNYEVDTGSFTGSFTSAGSNTMVSSLDNIDPLTAFQIGESTDHYHEYEVQEPDDSDTERAPPRAKERTIMFESTETLSGLSGEHSSSLKSDETILRGDGTTFYIGDTPIVRGAPPLRDDPTRSLEGLHSLSSSLSPPKPSPVPAQRKSLTGLSLKPFILHDDPHKDDSEDHDSNQV